MEQELKTHDQKVWPALVLKEEDRGNEGRRRDPCGAKKSNPVVVYVKVWW
jgi:hypothetical protein